MNSCADSQQVSDKKFCPSCGAATTTTCPKCQTKIKGYHQISGVLGLGGEEPARYCDNYGAAYPWTEAKIQAATQLAFELKDLTEDEKQQLKNALPDIIRDSPQTPVALNAWTKDRARR